MKKFIPLFLLPLLCTFSSAANMQFITVLSSPVGSFNKLETADTQQAAVGKRVNFCTKVGSQGTVELKGSQHAQLNAVMLAGGTTLGKTDTGKYSLNKITLHSGGTVEGGRLLGNNFEVDYDAAGKASNVYSNELTLAAAKTTALNVGNGNSVMNGTGASTQMVWSNEYQNDDACKTGSACAKQYLLKGLGQGESSDCSTPPDEEWRKAVKTCSAGGTLYGNWNENLCGYEPEEYVEVTMDCLDYEHVDPDTNNVVLLSGSCRLSKNAPNEGVNLYTKTLSETSWKLWDKVSPGGSLSWSDGVDHVVNPYNERKKEFAFGSDGSQEMIKTIGDCQYHFEINADSTDA